MMKNQRDMVNRPPLIGIPTWHDRSVAYAGVPLYGINQSYVNTLVESGAIPYLIPLNLDEEALYNIFDRLDGLFLSGGTDINPIHYGEALTGTEGGFDSLRDEAELKLARWALDNNLPVLGVCRGMQILNVAAGGTLYHDLATERPEVDRHNFVGEGFERNDIRHSITTAPKSYVRCLLGERVGVNSMHHQAVRRLGFRFRVSAVSDDGLTEAIEAIDHRFAVGLQWHPEELTDDPRQAKLFDDFIAVSAGASIYLTA